MKLTVTKNTQDSNGSRTLTLIGWEGLTGEIFIPLGMVEKPEDIVPVGATFTLTADPLPKPAPAPVPAAPVPVAPGHVPPAPVAPKAVQ